MADIAVIGAGYVGLTTGTCLAHLGHNVTIADIDEIKVQELNEGEVSIFEPGLSELLTEGIENGNLKFVVGAVSASRNAAFHFLCLPTPPNPSSAVRVNVIGVKFEKSTEGETIVRYLKLVFTTSICGPLVCSQL